MSRKAKISRKTKETSISVELNIDGRGKYKIDTGIGFLNHMLEQLSKHSSIDLNVKASAVEPANPAITFLFSIFLTLVAVLLTTVFPILTCPSPATTTSLFFLIKTIVVPCHLTLSVIVHIDGYEFQYFKCLISIIDIIN